MIPEPLRSELHSAINQAWDKTPGDAAEAALQVIEARLEQIIREHPEALGLRVRVHQCQTCGDIGESKRHSEHGAYKATPLYALPEDLGLDYAGLKFTCQEDKPGTYDFDYYRPIKDEPTRQEKKS